ncbi:CDP-alcohol phosphatidyltransferase family protein [Chloroflexota bacterium]
MTESIDELRKMCQDKERVTLHPSWWNRFLHKHIVHFTKLLLNLGVSANQATAMGLIAAVIGGVFWTFPSPTYWFIGMVFVALWVPFDYVDGQIARYNKTASIKGAFWAGTCHHFIDTYIPICLSFGLYRALNSIYPIITGFIGVLGIMLLISNQLLPFIAIHGRGLSYDAFAPNKAIRREEPTSKIIRYGRIVFHFEGLIVALLVATIIDYFISPFTIGFLSVNVRYVYFIIYALALFLNAVRRIYISLRGEFRLRL